MNVALLWCWNMWSTSAFGDLVIVNYSDTPTVHREADGRYQIWEKLALDAGPFQPKSTRRRPSVGSGRPPFLLTQ
jgi:hypothetical protein